VTFGVAAGSQFGELLLFFVLGVLKNSFVEACEQWFKIRGCGSDLL
jgi:hypothetical protein